MAGESLEPFLTGGDQDDGILPCHRQANECLPNLTYNVLHSRGHWPLFHVHPKPVGASRVIR